MYTSIVFKPLFCSSVFLARLLCDLETVMIKRSRPQHRQLRSPVEDEAFSADTRCTERIRGTVR